MGNETDDLFYVRGEANFAIGNIVDLGDNQMQFDFFTVQNTAVEKTFNLTSSSNSSVAISNAVVYLNNEIINPNAPSTFTLSVKNGDIITLEHENYQTLTYVIDAEFVNLSSGDVNLQLIGNQVIIDPQNSNTFQIETFINGIENFVADIGLNVKIFINNILQTFTSLIELKEGDKLKIVSENTETFSSVYSNGALTNNGSGNITVESNTIKIKLNSATCNYYLNIRDSNNGFINITSLFLFNNLTKEWEVFYGISIVYVNKIQVYALKNVPFYYTQVKVGYTAYNTTTIAVENINVGNSYYNIKLDKNIIQNTGDFIFGIADNIRNWFA